MVGAKPDNAVATEPTKAKRKETKPLQVYIPREEDANGKTVELENNEFWFMPYRKNKNAKHNPRNNSRGQSQDFKGKRNSGPASGGYKKTKRPDNRPPKAKEPVKPEDSPFAALLALKNKKD